MTFHRLLFFAESPRAPWPPNPAEYTAFAAEYKTKKAIDLTRGRFTAHSAAWSDPVEAADVTGAVCEVWWSANSDAAISYRQPGGTGRPWRAASPSPRALDP